MRHGVAWGLITVSLVVAAGSAWMWHREHRSERVLVLASGPQQSEFHGFAVALSRVIGGFAPPLTIRVIETYGSEENMALLADGTAQLALVSGSTPLDNKATVVDFLFPEVFHLIAREGTGIERVADLRDRVVGLPPPGSTSRTLFWRLIQHYGIEWSDLKTMTIEPKEAATALSSGSIDAYFVIIAVGTPLISEILGKSPTRLLPIDQAAALRLSVPALRGGEIPMGTYGGSQPLPPTNLPSVAERTLLVTSPAVDPDDIYEITRVLRESRQELVATERRAALMERVADPFDEGVPINPGAAKYFRRDRPLFVVRYAETMGFLLSAGVLLASTLWQLKMRADHRAKNRADNYNARIIELTERAQSARNRRDLAAVHDQLLATFKRVFSDLDQDRISSTSIQAFTLAWYTAVQIVEHRHASLPSDTGDDTGVLPTPRSTGDGERAGVRRRPLAPGEEAKPAA